MDEVEGRKKADRHGLGQICWGTYTRKMSFGDFPYQPFNQKLAEPAYEIIINIAEEDFYIQQSHLLFTYDSVFFPRTQECVYSKRAFYSLLLGAFLLPDMKSSFQLHPLLEVLFWVGPV